MDKINGEIKKENSYIVQSITPHEISFLFFFLN